MGVVAVVIPGLGVNKHRVHAMVHLNPGHEFGELRGRSHVDLEHALRLEEELLGLGRVWGMLTMDGTLPK